MQTKSPTVSIKLGDKDRTVVFNYQRLVAIEAATHGTVLQLVNEFASYAGDEKDPAAQADAAARFSITKTTQFLSGCFDVPAGELDAIVPMGEFRLAFVSLLPGFVDAVRQLNGMDQEPAADPQPAQVSPS